MRRSIFIFAIIIVLGIVLLVIYNQTKQSPPSPAPALSEEEVEITEEITKEVSDICIDLARQCLDACEPDANVDDDIACATECEIVHQDCVTEASAL